jgi:hypothetical protein
MLSARKEAPRKKEGPERMKAVPVIDRRYSLSEVPEAIWYVEEGHAKAKVVINVEQNSKRQGEEI